MKLPVAHRPQPARIDRRLLLEKPHGGRGARGREFPVARITPAGTGADRHVVRVANDVDLPPGKLREHGGDLPQHPFPFAAQFGLTRIEENPVENGHGQFPLKLRDGHVLRFERRAHFVLETFLHLAGLLFFLAQFLDLRAGLLRLLFHGVELRLRAVGRRARPGEFTPGAVEIAARPPR